jgi:phage tail-like protein
VTAEPYYPPGAFYFRVSVIRAGAGPGGPEIDSSFQEVSGLQAEFEVETVVEGGQNKFAWRLPRYVRYPNLVLKRGAVVKGSTLGAWMQKAFSEGLSNPIQPKDLTVTLLDVKGTPLMSWMVVQAYPLRWELAPLSSDENKVLIETLELAYCFFSRVPN